MEKTGKIVHCAYCKKSIYRKGFHIKKNANHFCNISHKNAYAFAQTCKATPKNLIHALYTIEQKSFRQIAKKLNINPRTIRKLLEHYDIPIRHGSSAVKTQWRNNTKRRETQAVSFANNVAPTFRPSQAEESFMRLLVQNKIQFVFQYPIHRYILDFALPFSKIAIEIDGREHKFSKPRKQKDIARDKWLSANNWTVFRLSNTDIINTTPKVLKIINSLHQRKAKSYTCS